MKKSKKIQHKVERRRNSYDTMVNELKARNRNLDGYHKPGSQNLNK